MKAMLNVCGEGGEYESLVLDCPLFKRRKINVKGYQMIEEDQVSYVIL
jgi:diphthine-ammonia ligase